MKNIVYIIAIIFWILSLISKSKKKQQQTAERNRIAALNKQAKKRPEKESKIATTPKRTSQEIRAIFAEKEIQVPATDYELAYASTDYAPAEKKTETENVIKKAEPLSHYKKNYGMIKSLGTESAEEKEAYDKDKTIIPRLSLTSGGIKQYIIASEILGKPKALRR